MSLTLPRWTDTIDSLPRVSPDENVYTDQKGNNNKSLVLRPDHKLVPCLPKLLENIIDPCDNVLNRPQVLIV